MILQLEDGVLFRGFPRIAAKLTEWSVTAKTRESQVSSKSEEALTEALVSSGLHTENLVKDLRRLPSIHFAEQQLVRYGAIDYLRALQRKPGGIGVESVLHAKEQGQGLILGCTHIGLFYHALIQAASLCDDLMVVTGNQRYSQSAVDRLVDLSGIKIRMIEANTKASMAIARQLKRGGVVATMLDLYVDSTLAIPAPFFGKPAATPVGIYQLAMTLGTPIVPISVTTGKDGGKTVEIDSVIEGAESVLELATKTNARIEAMVRRHANTWGIWRSLPERWRLAYGSQNPCKFT